MAKEYDRSAAAKKGWETRRANQRTKAESIIPTLKQLSPQNISRYSQKELLDIAKRANLAVRARERDFERKYEETTGEKYKGGFQREGFKVSQKTKIQRLRHVVIMQKKFLERKNTFEDFVKQAEKFERRIRARISVLNDPERSGEEKLTLGEKLQKREQEAETTLSLLEQQQMKKRFFELYEKALESRWGGSEPSKGSPVFAKVAEYMLENRKITLQELMNKLTEWDEETKSKDVNSRTGTSQEDLIKRGVAKNNNK